MSLLAVRAADYVEQVGESRYVGLPREEVERLFGSVELHMLTPETLNAARQLYLPIVTFTVVHYNYTWLTHEHAERSLGIYASVNCERDTPVFLDDSFERVARNALESSQLVSAPVDWRVAGLIRDDGHVVLVYVARLRQRWWPDQNRSPGRVTPCNNGELLTDRRRFDAWSQLLIDNLPSL